MIDVNLVFANFDRNTATDPFFNSKDESVSKAADMIKEAISNDFTIKYNITTFIELGFYSQDDYTITYPYKEEKTSIKTDRVKYVDYFFLRDSDFEDYKAKRKYKDKYLEGWLLANCFFEHYNLPENKDFYLIWRTEIYLDKQLYKTYDHTIRFVYDGAV
jgi:hypothetical protein